MYSLVVPTIPADLKVLLPNLERLFSFLPINELVLIGPKDLIECVPNDKRVRFINENELINTEKIKKIINTKLSNSTRKNRSGWYIQQFVKISYSRICEQEYYLLWDSDTIPTHLIRCFNKDDRPIFDIKKEYHKPYFDTIEMIFPGLQKQIDGSFISEHMLVKTSFMRQMIGDIVSNKRIEGDTYEEKILNGITPDALKDSGFSEFETYGNYVLWKFPDYYAIRKWNSMRFGGFFFPGEVLSEEDIEWLSEHYDAISFEKTHYLSKMNAVVNTNLYKKIFSSSSLDYLSMSVRLKRKLFP